MILDFFNKIKTSLDLNTYKKPIKETNDKETTQNEFRDNISELRKECIKAKKEEITIKKPKYVYEFKSCVLTEYYLDKGNNRGCTGEVLTPNYSVAAHNIPAGTTLYIPSLKGIVNDDGLFKAMDSGGHCFDFDICLSEDKKGKVGRKLADVYVVEWGKGKILPSYTFAINLLTKRGTINKYQKAWENYQKQGKLFKFYQFNDEDKNL